MPGEGGGGEKGIHLNEIESQGFVPRMCRAHFNFLNIFFGGGGPCSGLEGSVGSGPTTSRIFEVKYF